MSINDLRRCVGRPQNSPTGWLKVPLGRSLRVLGSSPVLASPRQVIVKYCIINACCLMRQLNGQSRRFLLTNSLKCLMVGITRLDSDLLGRPRAGCTARHGRTTRGNLSSTCRFYQGMQPWRTSIVCLVSFGSLLSKPKHTSHEDCA